MVTILSYLNLTQVTGSIASDLDCEAQLLLESLGQRF